MGPTGQKASLQCVNARGLLLSSNRVKMSMICDSLELHKSIGIMITETWLEDSALDAEVKIDNYDTFRTDRKGRKCGGTAILLRSELMCKLDTAYSNSVVETLVVKCKKLDTLFYKCIPTPRYKSE